MPHVNQNGQTVHLNIDRGGEKIVTKHISLPPKPTEKAYRTTRIQLFETNTKVEKNERGKCLKMYECSLLRQTSFPFPTLAEYPPAPSPVPQRNSTYLSKLCT